MIDLKFCYLKNYFHFQRGDSIKNCLSTATRPQNVVMSFFLYLRRHGHTIPEMSVQLNCEYKQNNDGHNRVTFFCTWRIVDDLQVTLVLRGQDLVLGLPQHSGCVAEILLLPVHCFFSGRPEPHVLGLGHLGRDVIQK